MAEALVLITEQRSGRGKQLANRLRRQGRVPAVLYGHKEATVSVSLQRDELEKAIRHGVRVLDLKSGDDVQKVLIREVQWDHLGKDLLHVDFARVGADERVEVTVPVELRGIAPGVAAGGVLDQPIHVLPVECLAISIPESIRVNVSELQIGSAIHVRDLVLPPGVTALAEPDAIVVQVAVPRVEVEPVAAAAAAAPVAEQAEPELIGRQKPVEEEEAE